MYFHHFVIISSWKGAGPFIWTNLNPLHPMMLCAKFGWFWIRRFLNFVNVFSLFHKYLPLEKGRALHLNKLESPSPMDTCAKFGWNWTSGSGEEDENVKSLQTDRQTEGRTDGQTDDGRQVTRKAHLSFQLRWAKNCYANVDSTLLELNNYLDQLYGNRYAV